MIKEKIKEAKSNVKLNPLEIHDGWIENLKNEKWGMIK